MLWIQTHTCPPLTRVNPEPLTHQSTSHQHPPRACSRSAPRAPQHSPTGRTPGPRTAPHPARCSRFQGQMSRPAQLPGPGHSPAADTPPRPLPGSRSHRTRCPRSRCARPPPALSTRCLLPWARASLCLKRQQPLLWLPWWEEGAPGSHSGGGGADVPVQGAAIGQLWCLPPAEARMRSIRNSWGWSFPQTKLSKVLGSVQRTSINTQAHYLLGWDTHCIWSPAEITLSIYCLPISTKNINTPETQAHTPLCRFNLSCHLDGRI